MKLSHISAVALSAALFAPMYAECADADTKSYSQTIESAPIGQTATFSLTAFDPALGTLTGVELTVSGSATDVYYSVQNTTGSSQAYTNATNTIELQVSLAANYVADTVSSGGYTTPAGSGEVAANTTINGPSQPGGALAAGSFDVLAADFHYFEGAGAEVQFTSTAVGLYGGSAAGGVNFGGNGDASGTFTVTYNYTSGVPELSTWAMMGLGFAGLGFAGYRSTRRRVPIGI